MIEDEFAQKIPRMMELIVGYVLFVISVVLFFLVIYFFVLSIGNDTFGVAVFSIEFVLSFLTTSLSVLSYRLVKNKGVKGSSALLSNMAIKVWGVFFGVFGFVIIFTSISTGQYFQMIFGLFSILIGSGSFQFVKSRSSKNAS